MVAETDYLTSGQIHFTGLGSGTDFDTMINKLVEIESQHITRLQTWKQSWQDKITAFQELNTAMLNLESTLKGMDSLQEFFIKTTDTTDSTILTASASSSAQVGTHSIEINQLAQNHVLVSKNSFASEDTIINNTGGDETLTYTYNGENVTLTIPDGTSLSTLVNLINNDPNNPGIRASILKKSDNTYHLQLKGLDLGSNYSITITGGPSSFDSDASSSIDNSDFFETQSAQNSQIKVDGFPSDGTWIERSSNTLDDVITGLTLNLKDTGTVQLTVSNDTSAIKEQIVTFVDQVNSILSIIREQTKVDNSTGEGSLLTGNYGLQIIQQKIKDILSSKGIGFDRNSDTYTVLASIGITTDANESSPTLGQLLLDESKLDEALSNDPQAVAEIFSADYVPTSSSSDFRYYSHISGITQGGVYTVSYTVSGGVITSATIDGKTASISNNILTATEGDAKGLAIQVDNLTDGTYSGTLRLKYGKILELRDSLDELTDSDTGPLNVLEDNYNEIIEDIDEKIAWEQKRIERYERDLRDRFARLEELLGYYNQLDTQLSSQIKSLGSGSSS